VALDLAAPTVVVRPMLTTDRAVDLFLGDLARRGYSERTRTTYSRLLDKLCDRLPDDHDVSRITPDDCRRYLNQWSGRSAGTRAHTFSVLSSFLGWLYENEKIGRNPLDRIERPRRLPAADLDVVTVQATDVVRLLAAADGWPERLALGILCYMGPRRRAVARLRLRDYDRLHGRIRFREKGGKTIWKPVPDELRSLLDAAIADGAIPEEPDAYLVPPEGYLQRAGDRDDRVVWRLIKRCAARAGVEAHAQALRAAFACFYLEQHPGDVEALKELMGHRSIATTQVYLRKLDRQAAMERVRGLSWTVATPVNDTGGGNPQFAGERLASSAGVGAGGFEPP
jgi:integrase/recombinase XerC